jgi:hypothetical protein
MRKSLLLTLTALAALTAALTVAALAPPAHAQALSEGCAELNNPSRDNFALSGGPVTLPFAAGDHITITAGLPKGGGQTPTGLWIGVDGTVAASTAVFPGTVEYTIPTAGTHSVDWSINAITNATWTVSCTPAPVDPVQAITGLKSSVSGMGLPKGTTTALNATLQAALGYLAVNDTADAHGALNAFRNQVTAFTKAKTLTSTQAQQLTDAAKSISDAIGS